ncbi:MAG: arginine--tRNA ligase, partial [Flavitalea sp.]
MTIVSIVQQAAATVINKEYGLEMKAGEIQVTETKPEFEGDYTVVLFSLIKKLKKSPDALGQELGTALLAAYPDLISGFNLIKGFLNISVSDRRWLDFVSIQYTNTEYGQGDSTGKKVLVEY